MSFLIAVLCLTFFPLNSLSSFDVNDEYVYSIMWNNGLDKKLGDSSLLIKTTNNETYACYFPSTTMVKEIKAEDGDLDPIHLLDNLFRTYPCIFKVEGFWTFELCHGKHIRQFRAEGSGPKSIQIVKEYYLGRISDLKEPHEIVKAGTKSSDTKVIKINDKNFSYYSVDYDYGTVCDLTGAPRKASVLYACLQEFDGELFQISELETCVYQLIVFTRHLCSSPRYNSHQVYSNPITCIPNDENSSLKPKALFSLEKEKLTFTVENEQIESVLGALRVKGIKVEKLNSWGNVVYRVRTLDPLDADQETESSNEEDPGTESVGVQKATDDADLSPSNPRSPVAGPMALSELRIAQQRELQSFLSGRTCLIGGAGWWRHKVCYGTSIIQYHNDTETGDGIEIVLGRWDEAVHLDWVKQNALRKTQSPAGKRVKLTHFYGNGDFCEEINAPRSVKLSLICQRKVSTAIQLSFSEPSICQYSISLEGLVYCDLLEKASDDGLLPPEVTA